jgi:hypothetical protein
MELRFSKVRTAKKKKDKAGRKLGKGGNIGEGLRKTSDISLRDTSNFVLWEFSVSILKVLRSNCSNNARTGGTPAYYPEFWHGQFARKLLS